MIRRLLLAIAFSLFASTIHAQTFRVPFNSVNGMILLDGQVNGKPAVLLLDTGANNTIISPQAAGLTTVQLRSLQASKEGTGAEGDCVVREVDLWLAERHWMNRRALVMDLSDASKRLGAKIDGFIGQDVLREFSAVRIDYKAGLVEFEK